jgi:AAA+ lid domain
MAAPKAVPNSRALLRLWVHESTRVFCDRLVCSADREWFNGQLKTVIEGDFKTPWAEVLAVTFLTVNSIDCSTSATGHP